MEITFQIEYHVGITFIRGICDGPAVVKVILIGLQSLNLFYCYRIDYYPSFDIATILTQKQGNSIDL